MLIKYYSMNKILMLMTIYQEFQPDKKSQWLVRHKCVLKQLLQVKETQYSIGIMIKTIKTH